MAPVQFHTAILATFASLIAPFGGFFASGLKRTFKIKDFGHSIPGHGGITDRMDCQFIMGFFAYIYYHTFIATYKVGLGSVMEMAITGLTAEEQIELFRGMGRYLANQNIIGEEVKQEPYLSFVSGPSHINSRDTLGSRVCRCRSALQAVNMRSRRAVWWLYTQFYDGLR